MNNMTTVYVVRDEDNEESSFIALFVDGEDAYCFADDYGFIVEEHFVPDDANNPWLM